MVVFTGVRLWRPPSSKTSLPPGSHLRFISHLASPHPDCSNTNVTSWTLPCHMHFPTLQCPPWHLCPTARPHSSSHPSLARGAEGPLCMPSLGDINPRLHAPAKQRKHLLTAKALTNSTFQMNPAPCGAEGGECPGEKSPKHLLVFADYRKPGGAVRGSCRVDSPTPLGSFSALDGCKAGWKSDAHTAGKRALGGRPADSMAQTLILTWF